VSILPWCLFMGTTFPFMMAYIASQREDNAKSFSFLYLANVLGAMSGTILTAIVFVEMFGFHHTLWIAAAGNFVIAGISGWAGARGALRPMVQQTGELQKPYRILASREESRTGW